MGSPVHGNSVLHVSARKLSHQSPHRARRSTNSDDLLAAPLTPAAPSLPRPIPSPYCPPAPGRLSLCMQCSACLCGDGPRRTRSGRASGMATGSFKGLFEPQAAGGLRSPNQLNNSLFTVKCVLCWPRLPCRLALQLSRARITSATIYRTSL